MINISKSEEIKILKKPIKRNIIFISTAHEWKGIRILEKIAQRLKNYNFFVCGYDYKPNLKNVKYLGLLNEGGLKKAIYNSDVFIFPSQYEGQSLAILDSLAMGLPIIISKESDPIIAKNGENGFIIKNRTDISEYIKKIDFLFSNPELIQSMKAKNIELMRNYTWKKQGGKYLKLVREII
jgi:glycosyltransferase involved in cell wall biosynthesis